LEYDYSLLRETMRDERHSIRSLAKATDMHYGTLSGKLNNKSEFRVSEIIAIARELDISDVVRYFFTPKVRKTEQEKQ